MHLEDQNSSVKLVRGRTANSQNLLHAGFRYSKDTNLMKDGRQSWRCVRKNDKCRGRVYTIEGRLHSVGKPHIHEPDLADCEVKEALSSVQDPTSTSSSSSLQLYITSTENLSDDARSLLPSRDAIRRRIQRARVRQQREALYPHPYDDTPYLNHRIARDLAAARPQPSIWTFSESLKKELEGKTRDGNL